MFLYHREEQISMQFQLILPVDELSNVMRMQVSSILMQLGLSPLNI